MNNVIPDKYTDLSNCILTITASIVSIILENSNSISLFQLFTILSKKYKSLSDDDFIISLNILYAYNIILYDPNSDSMRLSN